MIVEDPEVTLEVEAHDYPEEARETAMCLWDCCVSAYGDDGRQYWIDASLGNHKSLGTFAGLPLGAMDIWTMGVRWGKGKVVQSPNSVYKIADFPQTGSIGWHPHQAGDLTVKKSKNEVAVDLGDIHLICKPDDKTWHYTAEDKEKGIKAEWVHTGIGLPCWYGKEKPRQYAPHVIAYGYMWAGTVKGTLAIEGRKVGIKGAGMRERYYAVDACTAEMGGWFDWMWFCSNEVCVEMEEHKLSKEKDMALYLVDEKKFLPTGSFNIEHHDWAYLRPLGAFIPTRYKATVETEAGVLEIDANVVGCHVWAASSEVPDAPLTNLHWDNVNGTFTYKDGRKRTLTNALGGTLIQQWKPYPNVLSPEMTGAGMTETTDDFHPI